MTEAIYNYPWDLNRKEMDMLEAYEELSIEVIEFDQEDVIITSGGYQLPVGP